MLDERNQLLNVLQRNLEDIKSEKYVHIGTAVLAFRTKLI